MFPSPQILQDNVYKALNLLQMSNQSKTFIVKQLKYIDITLEHSWKVPILQELLNTRMV